MNFHQIGLKICQDGEQTARSPNLGRILDSDGRKPEFWTAFLPPGSGLRTILGPEPDGATLGAWGDGSIFRFFSIKCIRALLSFSSLARTPPILDVFGGLLGTSNGRPRL